MITTNNKKIGSGLVFGKFLPLHEGHVYLLNFARRSCNKLTILVCSLKNEPIPGQIRYEWVKEMFPDCNVIHHDIDIPQGPSEHPDFWNIWKETIKKHCPGEEFDVLFGSEDYGWKMAQVMGIEYAPVNRLRNLVPISGTEIRKDPMKNWQYLPTVTRPYFVKRIAIVGPESAGKTTLAKSLAQKYQTVWVPEYARGLLDEFVAHQKYKPGEVRYADISKIARGQINSEEALAYKANKVMFTDTDLITTCYWSDYYFHRCPTWIKNEAYKHRYSLYFLMDTDVPYTPDSQRPMTKLTDRKNFFNWWKKELEINKQPYVVLGGSWKNRFNEACKETDKLVG